MTDDWDDVTVVRAPDPELIDACRPPHRQRDTNPGLPAVIIVGEDAFDDELSRTG